jgi:hypothetical protein
MHALLFKFTFALNSVPPFWKLVVLELLFCIYNIILCSMYTVPVKIVFVVDALQLLLLFLWMLKYLNKNYFS